MINPMVFVHNTTDGTEKECGACKSRPATWTLSASYYTYGTVAAYACKECMAKTDINKWTLEAKEALISKHLRGEK